MMSEQLWACSDILSEHFKDPILNTMSPLAVMIQPHIEPPHSLLPFIHNIHAACDSLYS